MSAVLLHALVAVTVFLEQDVPGLRFGAPDALTGVSTPNYRHIDFDRDGSMDILLPGRILMQRDGLFPAGAFIELPEETRGTVCDTYGDALYLRHGSGLRILRWDNEQWTVALDQTCSWPDTPAPTPVPAEGEAGPTALPQLVRFLYDIEEDGTPEIVLYARDGVHVFQLMDGVYSPSRFYDIYPSATTTSASTGKLWPDSARVLSIPGQTLDLRALWRGPRLTVVSRQELRNGMVVFRSRSTDLSFEPDSEAGAVSELNYPILTAHMHPIFLNKDETLDFAGGAVEVAAMDFAEPLFDSFATTDGGLTIQRIRTKSYSPRSIFVDVDGDGDFDLATHRTEITSGGLRESLNRYFFQRRVGHEISFSVQNNRGQFVPAPMMTVKFEIELDKVPYREGSVFRRYRAGDLIDVTGDFNGDGYKDLVVQDSGETLAIYLSRAYRFSKHPIYRLTIGRAERFYIADVDANGLSDIVLIRPGVDQSGDRSRVYLSRETKP